MTKFDTFCEKYLRKFTYDSKRLRSIGIEKEILLTDKDGFMADVYEKVWPTLNNRGYKTARDSFYRGQITGFFIKDNQVTTELGRGTFELILEPKTSIKVAENQMKDLLRVLYPICEKQNLKILSIGCQPRTRPLRSNVARKQRYEVLYETYKKNILPASLSASDQVHVDMTLDEFVPVLNMLNGLAGFLLVLFSNSPLRYGRVNKFHVIREIFWDSLGKARTGVPLRPFTSPEDYLKRVWDFKCIMCKKGNKFFCTHKKFRDHVRRLSDEELFKAFLIHEGTVYMCARPRVFGTVEVRPACLQPWGEMMVVPAFVLGLVENLIEADAFVKNFDWKDLRELRYQAMKKGFNTKIQGKIIAPFLKELLDISKRGLIRRNQGAEAYLKPLYKRVAEEQSPADRAVEHFKKGGMPLFLDKVSLKKRHLK